MNVVEGTILKNKSTGRFLYVHEVTYYLPRWENKICSIVTSDECNFLEDARTTCVRMILPRQALKAYDILPRCPHCEKIIEGDLI